MSSLAQRLTSWIARARAQLATAAASVVRARVPRERATYLPLSWAPHAMADRLARRVRRSSGERRPGSPSGGRAVLQRYGERFYAAIGALGGATLANERGSAYMHDIGLRGGTATRQRYGRNHYAEIGRQGGLAGRGRKRPRKRPAAQLELPL